MFKIPMKKSLLQTSTAVFLLISIWSSSAYAIDHIIETTNGKVQGSTQQSLVTWTGIPYGKAPQGELRWKKPEPVSQWSETFDATKPAQNCIQTS